MERILYAPPVAPERIAEWQAKLGTLAAQLTREAAELGVVQPSWLHLLWMPGYPWQPVNRWIIAQMMPPGPDDDDDGAPDNLQIVWKDLHGPDPADFTRWDAGLGKVVRKRRFLIDRYQWQLFRETGCFATYLWVVQGSHGGHKRSWDDIESAVSEMRGGPAQPPAMGDLPYAEPDARTFEQLGQLNLLAQYKDCIAFAHRSPEQLEAEEHERVYAMKGELWNWLSTQVEESFDPGSGDGLTRPMLTHIIDTARRDGKPIDEDATRHRFVTSDY